MMLSFILRPHNLQSFHKISFVFHRSLYITGDYFSNGGIDEIQLNTPVPIAGRKFLPGSASRNFPRLLASPRASFPQLLKACNSQKGSLKDWGQRARDVIDRAFNSYRADGIGVALLFRGLPIQNEQDLNEWAEGLCYDFMQYTGNGGNGPREQVAKDVTAGSATSQEFTIELHNDQAYMSKYPKLFAMGCFQTPQSGEETAICNVRDVASKLDPEFVKKISKKGIRYTQFLPDKSVKHEPEIRLCWQAQYQTEDSGELEAILKDQGCEFRWEGNSIRSWHILPPYINHPKSDEQLWFNQITMHHKSYFEAFPELKNVKLPDERHPYYSHATYGDGEEFEEECLDQVRSAAWSNAVGFQWRSGDVLFLDQLVIQHSRLGFAGNRRVGIVSMTY